MGKTIAMKPSSPAAAANSGSNPSVVIKRGKRGSAKNSRGLQGVAILSPDSGSGNHQKPATLSMNISFQEKTSPMGVSSRPFQEKNGNNTTTNEQSA